MADLQFAGRVGRERILRKKLDPVRDGYDFILIDCPPTLGLLTINALAAAIAFLLGDKSSHALLLHQGELTDIALPASCTKPKLRERVSHLPAEVKGWIDAFNDRQKAQSQAAGEDIFAAQEQPSSAQVYFQTALEEIAQSQGKYEAGWYYSYRIAYGLTHGKRNNKAHRAAFTAWQNKVQETLAFLSEEFWPPVVAALEACHPDKGGIKQVLLMPSGLTSLLPLHAAAPSHHRVGYIPSLSVWQRSHQRAARRSADSLFVATPVADLPIEEGGLPFTEAEAEWLALRFPPETVKRLLRPQATANAIQTEACGYGIVHFSGHARYNWEEPNNSYLECEDSTLELATIRREMDLSAARLVTLSACGTGVSDVFNSGEEFIGLPAGLLEAGAPAVVASLWPVHDVSTAFLMDRFYGLWLESDISIAQALQQATQWLRHASKADLLQRIAASPLPPRDQKRVQKLLEKAIAQQQTRMAGATARDTATQIFWKPDEHPFAHPFYWAAFAAYGAVL